MTEAGSDKRAYDNSRRRQKALLAGALRALEKGVTQETERVPRRVRNFRKRVAKLPPDRKCTQCGEVTTASKSWVVGAAIARGLTPMCKRCWAKLLKASDDAQQETSDDAASA